VLNETVV